MNKKIPNADLNRLSQNEFKTAKKTPIIVILDNIRSLNNIGAVFRTSDAFLIKKIYLCGITAKPPHRDIRKTALGATETVAWEYVEDTYKLVSRLKDNDTFICAVEQVENAYMLQDFNPPKERTLILVFGNEVDGVQQNVIDLCDACIEIPQYGTKHSLNIAVSAGIVLWDMKMKLQ